MLFIILVSAVLMSYGVQAEQTCRTKMRAIDSYGSCYYGDVMIKGGCCPPGDVIGEPSYCEDFVDSCEQNKDFCTRGGEWTKMMRRTCQKTCGFC